MVTECGSYEPNFFEGQGPTYHHIKFCSDASINSKVMKDRKNNAIPHFHVLYNKHSVWVFL